MPKPGFARLRLKFANLLVIKRRMDSMRHQGIALSETRRFSAIDVVFGLSIVALRRTET